jgi:hypothetical protein
MQSARVMVGTSWKPRHAKKWGERPAGWSGSERLRLMQPDAVLPEQLRSRRALSSEQRLMVAVLENAVECYQKYALLPNRRARRLFKETHEWIYCDETDWPFSFENICAALAIDAGYLRSGLERWMQRAVY